MKKKYWLAALFLLGLGLSAATEAMAAEAAEENQNGGQVTTQGVITFYEESDKSPAVSSEAAEMAVDASSKPAGSYPATGEVIKHTLSISGLLLLLLSLALFLRKKKRAKKAEEQL